jgi:23S rRNA (pseudouridine1915-N3)-methyltransferase
MDIRIICVGKLKEKFYLDAAGEYLKRLKGFCQCEIIELNEIPREKNPSPASIDAALKREAADIMEKVQRPCTMVAMCVEGKQTDSPGIAEMLDKCAMSGAPRMCFVIGGSDGLHPSVKQAADVRLSMSKMTFPHMLARVMLAEQTYRAFTINHGKKYHK